MAEDFWYLHHNKAHRELGFMSRDPRDTLKGSDLVELSSHAGLRAAMGQSSADPFF